MSKLLIVFLGMVVAAPLVFSQQQDEVSAEATNQVAQDEQQDAPQTSTDTEPANAQSKRPATATATSKSRETFVPTEDISEDLSVSFPVDI